jgi:hypothetical protein
MKLKSTLALLSVCLVLVAFVATRPVEQNQELFVQSESCGCEDAESGPAYNFGKFKGQCIDSCRFKPITATNNGQIIQIAQIRDVEEFINVEVDLNDLLSVHVTFERFQPKINHVALVFMFDRTKSELPPLGLVMSAEAILPLDVKYTLSDGLLSNYAINYQSYTLDRYIEHSREKEYPLKKYRLKLTEDEMKNLFLDTLDVARNLSFQTVYHLITRNCATSVWDLILAAKKEEVPPAQLTQKLLDPMRGFPFENFGTKKSLAWWQLIEAEETWLHIPEQSTKAL